MTTNTDPEYAWLRREMKDEGLGIRILRFEKTSNWKKHRPSISNVVRLSSGFVLQVAGFLWLLSILGIPIPWSSVLAVGVIVAGGFFIAVSLSSNANHKRLEA